MKLPLSAWVSIGLLGLFFVGSLAIQWPLKMDAQSFDPNLVGGPLSPSFAHIFGTDDAGRDTLLRCLSGAKLSLSIGLVSVMMATSIGLAVGLVSGFSPRWIDAGVMRFVDFVMALPTFFLILSIQVLLKPSIWNVVVVIGATSWMGTARMVRASVLSLKERPFILVARARGLSSRRLLFKHILPHTLSPVLVSAMLGMGHAILTESVLSFLGLGVQPPCPSWGNMLEDSLSYMYQAPWMAIAPGMCIVCVVMATAVIGDAWQERIQQI